MTYLIDKVLINYTLIFLQKQPTCMTFGKAECIYRKRTMDTEFKKRKVVVRITETQFNRLMDNLIVEDKSISQFIRESIKEKLNQKK